MHMPDTDSGGGAPRRPNRRRILATGAASLLLAGGGIRLASPLLLRGGWVLAPGDV